MDWSFSIIPSLIFSVSGARSSGSPPTTLAPRYILLILWNTCFVYFFNLSNQITGIVEDRVDKPHRPLPSGKVTLAGAEKRRIVVLLVWLLTSIRASVLKQMICWTVTTGFLTLTDAGNHWFGKNTVALTAGTWSLYTASWKIIAPETEQSIRYAWAIAFWAGVGTHVQDLRDIAGDAANGRKTLPIVFGDRCSRWLMTFIAIPLQIVVLWLGCVTQVAPLPIGAAHAIVAWHVMQGGRGPKYDHKTYMVSCSRIVNWMTTDSLDGSITDGYLHVLSLRRLCRFRTNRVRARMVFYRRFRQVARCLAPHHDLLPSADRANLEYYTRYN